MTAWVRFNNGGNTGFGTLIGEAVAVFEGDMFGIATPTGETLAKEVAALTARSVTLASVNPAYAPRTVARRDILWMGRILWVSQ